ncbi:ricin-type beta-trefoil lectin domain protein [Actinoplanes sp. NPDC049548]|uniref:ricin-type beta-trefoil lectin domain protein n=1 Tax=Actinoplanes sp. NPDC049548 TaxID=3155152 RepID=UPI003416B17C
MTRPRRLGAIGAAVALTAATGAYLITAAPASLAATAASVWLTTPDRANLLTQKGDVAFGTSGSGPVITVNPNTTYQSMVGFGASFTDAAAWNVYNSASRNTIMNNLFGSNGIGLSFVRQPIGASDFSRSFYTYDDGSADPSLSRFSVAHDQAYILPLLTQARSLNPNLTFMGTPWSAPAWMKTNNNLIGGSLNTAQNGTYADYLVKFVQAYQNAGVPIGYLSVQNEPQFSPPGYPGMLMSAQQQSDIINNLGPKLRTAGLSTKILGWDHNWDNTSYPQTVNTNAGSNVVGSAWHCYAGDPSAQSTVHNAQPAKEVFFTECSGTESSDTSRTFADSLLWQGRNLAVGSTRNWARTVSLWNMALDTNHGPVIGSCTNCMGVVTVNGSSVTYNAEYYVLGHLSKFVKPGAVRIDSTVQGQGGIENVAFRNPDGSIALVAVNSGGTQNFQVSYGGSTFGYQLPAGAMATFTWPGSVTPPTTPPAGTTGTITGYGGKCVDVDGANPANGTVTQLYTCNGSAAQQWTVGSDGTLRALGKCLDVAGVGTANGTRVQIWDCTGGDNQRWTATGGTLRAVNSGRCLDATGVSSADRTPLQIWDCTGGANQQWKLPA